MSRDDTTLLVVDVQERLLRAMREPQRLVWNIERLLDGARLMGVAAAATEQYPQGLGPTVPSLAERLGQRPAAAHEKLAFSCWGCDALRNQLEQLDRPNVLVCGIETHVCVQQTTLDLLAAGYRVFVAVDATTSRMALDHDVALRRMETHGATLTTVEAALFEWCLAAGTPEFKAISQLVKQTFPTETHS
ncbi:MAG: hydrolase [Pirellulales bacterium]